MRAVGEEKVVLVSQEFFPAAQSNYARFNVEEATRVATKQTGERR
jgi:hypothetical protein